MSAQSRRRFQRVALVVIGCLLVVLGVRQLAYAAHGPDRCHLDGHRLGYYEEHESRQVLIHRHDAQEDVEMHIIVN